MPIEKYSEDVSDKDWQAVSDLVVNRVLHLWSIGERDAAYVWMRLAVRMFDVHFTDYNAETGRVTIVNGDGGKEVRDLWDLRDAENIQQEAGPELPGIA